MSAPPADAAGASGGPPIIGLTAYSERVIWGSWQAAAVLLPENYASQLRRAGGVPVLLPPVPGIAAAAARLDGLVLTGGGDVEPERYGQPPHRRTGPPSPARDQAELDLLGAALDAGLPVLGICRGLQVLNVGLGGTLRQHLPDGSGHRQTPGTVGTHPVTVTAGSRLAEILGGGRGDLEITVPTSHHQAIGRLGRGLRATAWSADGVIEAAELGGGHPFVLGVQWHPEAGRDPRLFEALVVAAVAARAGRPAGQALHSRA